jgi:hypothetical protein
MTRQSGYEEVWLPRARGQEGSKRAFEREDSRVVSLWLRLRRIVILEPIPATFPFDPINCLSRGRPVAACA